MATYAVLGNSSSILKDGWVSFFKTKFDNKIVNLSLGGSPTPANIYQLLVNFEKLKEVDYILIAPTIDWKLAETPQGSTELDKNVMFLTKKIASLNKLMIYVDQPQLHNLYEIPRASEIWKFHIKKEGGLIVDLFYTFRKLLELNKKLKFDNFFRDDRGHLNVSMSIWTASFVNAFCDNYVIDKKIKRANSFVGEYAVINASNILVDEKPSQQFLKQRASSLGKFELLPIQDNKTYSINIHEESCIVGALWNFGDIIPSVGEKIMWRNNNENLIRTHKNSFLHNRAPNKPVLIFEQFKNPFFKCVKSIFFSSIGNKSENNIELSGFLISTSKDSHESAAIGTLPDNIYSINDFSNFVNLYLENNYLLDDNLLERNLTTADFFKSSDLDRVVSEYKPSQNGPMILFKSMAIAFENDKQFDVALKLFEAALLLKPDAYWIRYKVSVLHLNLGNYELAKKYAEELVNAPAFAGKDAFLKKLKI